MRFRVMSIVFVLALVACTSFVINPTIPIQAQSATPPLGIVTSDYTPATLTLLDRESIPGFGVLIADLRTHVTANVAFDTWANLQQYCRNTVLYRVTGMGDLIAHPFVCDGNTMMFNGTGGNHDDMSDYIVALFPSARAAQAAPQNVIRNISTEALPNQYNP